MRPRIAAVCCALAATALSSCHQRRQEYTAETRIHLDQVLPLLITAHAPEGELRIHNAGPATLTCTVTDGAASPSIMPWLEPNQSFTLNINEPTTIRVQQHSKTAPSRLDIRLLAPKPWYTLKTEITPTPAPPAPPNDPHLANPSPLEGEDRSCASTIR